MRGAKEKMNKSKVIVLLVVLNLLLVGICLNFSNKNMLLINEKQIIKEMTQSENEANLQIQIDQLNASHKEYVTNVQAYKKQIAEAVTNQGIATSENDEGSVIAENIEKILQAQSKGKSFSMNVTIGGNTTDSGGGTYYQSGTATITYNVENNLFFFLQF